MPTPPLISTASTKLKLFTRHDVVAFTRAVSETLGEEKKWVHYGLTSSDVVDTAWAAPFEKSQCHPACGD